MDFNEKRSRYSQLIIHTGVNLQKGEELVIECPVECAEFGRLLTEDAYKAGAKDVSLQYYDEKFGKLRYLYTDKETLCDIPQWTVAQKQHCLDRKACRIYIESEDPELLADADSQKVAAHRQAKGKAYEAFADAITSNQIKWCVVSIPTPGWAKKIFPDVDEGKAVEQLWEAIFAAMRLNEEDPVAAWEAHNDQLAKRSDFMNQQQFKELHYRNSAGTDFRVALPEGYLFSGGRDLSQDGCTFVANMPTEEIFTAPLKTGANGRLVAAMPLCVDGNLVDNFWFEFKDGKVADFGAEKGYDTLKGVIDTDEGSHYLGEAALVGYDNPIRNMGILFYNTLFDENASCHFALGQSYNACIKDGDNMSKEDQEKAGLNQSLEHVDFMIGTQDLSVVGIKQDGTEVPIFKDGNFVV